MSMKNYSSVAIVGAGCWGTALSLVAAQSQDPVVLWTPLEEQAELLAKTRVNTPLLGNHIPLPSNIHPTTCLDAVIGCDLVLVVVPSSAMRSVAERLKEAGLPESVPLVSCTKGIELGTSKRMTQILGEVLPHNPLAVLSGPNHAEEVSRGLPGISLIGCADQSVASAIQRRLSGAYFRLYTSTDVSGMELGGAIKNVFAIAAGICEGLALGDNAKAGLVTRALAEMTRLGIAMGGRQETFTGLSGIGDLMVTCYSPHSRNNSVGRYIAEGLSIEDILKKVGSVAEGVPNARSIYETSRCLDVRTPLIDAVYTVIYEGKRPADMLKELLLRDLRAEME